MDRLFIALHTAALNFKPNGVSGLARSMGKRENTFATKLNPTDDLHQPTIGEFVSIVDRTGDTTPLEVLCEMFDGKFVTKTSESHDSVMAAVLHAVSEGGDVCRAVEESLPGGIDEKERERINREISEQIHSLTVLKNTVNKEAS